MFQFNTAGYPLFCMNLQKVEHFLKSEFFWYLMYYFYVKTLKHFCHCTFLYIIVSQQVDGLFVLAHKF